MSQFSLNGTPTLGAAPGVIVDALPPMFLTYCGLSYATMATAQDMTMLGPGMFTMGYPNLNIMGMPVVFTGAPTSMGNVAGPSAPEFFF